MQDMRIEENSVAGWLGYANTFGFVPDPMILRTGEVFLNGASGSKGLIRDDSRLWNALRENIGGLVDFFDLLVTRGAIPLINYEDSFDMMRIVAPLKDIIPDRMHPVTVGYTVYNTVKKGALLNLGALDPVVLRKFAVIANELEAFRYEWEPALGSADGDPAVAAVRDKFAKVDGVERIVAQFLLGGLIFSGFAQASGTIHYSQPKRARFFLGLTAASDRAGLFSSQDEDRIFASAMERLHGSSAEVRSTESVPPVLPYLLSKGDTSSVRVLLDRALEFRESADGKRYREVADKIRDDGIEARRTEDLAKVERDKALKFLAPYSKLDADRSRSLDIKLSAETVGLPVKLGAETTINVEIPNWLRLWWNDYVPFGGMRKTLRRMWMAADSYQDLSGKLRQVWAKS